MRQKLSQYQIAQRARRARERRVEAIHQHAAEVVHEKRVVRAVPPPKAGGLDAMADGLIAVAQSGPDSEAMLVRIFANLPMPETFLLARLLLGLEREQAVSFVKRLGNLGNVQSDPKSWR